MSILVSALLSAARSVLSFLAGTLASLLILLASVFCVEAFFVDSLNTDLFSKISRVYDYFISDDGKVVLAPMTILLGALFGYVTADSVSFSKYFWTNLIFLSISICLLLVLVVSLGTPQNKTTGALAEAGGFAENVRGLYNFFSAAAIAITTWLTNRFTVHYKANVSPTKTEESKS